MSTTVSAKAPSRRKEKHLDPEQLKEIDQKRLKGELSCAECRRLKLRCDKKVPCGSCSRRGCISICPLGTLEAGVGTRYILASTDQLHTKINTMSSRIRALEDALTVLQATVSSERHPLLEDELLKIKFGSETLPAVDSNSSQSTAASLSEPPELEAFGTMTLNDEGEMKYFGRSAGSETLILVGREESAMFNEEDENTVPPELFLLGLDSGQGLTVADLLQHLPSRSRAEVLAQSYIDHVTIFFRAVKKEELFDSALPLIYSSLISSPGAESGGSIPSPIRSEYPNATRAGLGSPSNLSYPGLPSPHLLSTVFLIFAVGSFFELSSPVKQYVSDSEMWFQLGKKALTCSRGIVHGTHHSQESSPNDGTPSPGRQFEDAESPGGQSPRPFKAPPSSTEDTVRALGLMATYLSMSGKKYARDSAWYAMSLAAKVAQGSGMHRDPARWHMDPTTVQRRRNLWWEVFTADVAHSIALGRPPSIHLSFIDCEFPTDEEATLSDTGEETMGFWRMKYIFAREGFTPAISTTLNAKSPMYSTILDLDRKIREINIPAGVKPYASVREDGPGVYSNSHFALRDFYADQHRIVTMLYIHRFFFARAMLTHSSNPLRSPFAPSVLAAYRAASASIKSMVHLYDRCSALVPRMWFLTHHIFSAAVIVGTVVKRSPNSSIAGSALADFRLALDLFSRCACSSTRNKIAFAILRKFNEKVVHAYTKYLANSKNIALASSTSFKSNFIPAREPNSSSPNLQAELDLSLFNTSPEDDDVFSEWACQPGAIFLNQKPDTETHSQEKDSPRSGSGLPSLGSDPSTTASSSLSTSSGDVRYNNGSSVDPNSSTLSTPPSFWNDANAQMGVRANVDPSPHSAQTFIDSMSSMFVNLPQTQAQPQPTTSPSLDVAMADLANPEFGFDFGGFGFDAGAAADQGLLMDMALEDHTTPTNNSTSSPSTFETNSVLMQYLSETAQAAQVPLSFGSQGAGGASDTSFGQFDFGGSTSHTTGRLRREERPAPNASDLYSRFMNYIASQQQQQSMSQDLPGSASNWMQMMQNQVPTPKVSPAWSNPTSTGGSTMGPTEEDYNMFFESLFRHPMI